jgi:hypothetical protein
MKELKEIERNLFYKKTFNILLNIGLENLKINYDKLIISFSPKSTETYNFELTFWLNENRISFNIDKWYEVLDDYIQNEIDSTEIYNFINTIFTNELIIEEYSTFKNNKIIKKKLIFKSLVEDGIKEFNLDYNVKYSFPWVKFKLQKINRYKKLY